MPMHDWTRLPPGPYHDFHNAWITHLKEALNAGLLPPSYYALGEQRTGDRGPDVVTLRTERSESEDDGFPRLSSIADDPNEVKHDMERLVCEVPETGLCALSQSHRRILSAAGNQGMDLHLGSPIGVVVRNVL